MKFNAHRGNALISRLIRLFSPKYNHISIEIDGFIYEAHAPGITKTPVKKWDSSTVVETISIRPISKEKVVSFLDKQVGKKYDFMGICSFIWVFMKPQKDRWYCSELAQVALYKALGIRSTADDYNQRVSPYQFWKGLKVIRKIYV